MSLLAIDRQETLAKIAEADILIQQRVGKRYKETLKIRITAMKGTGVEL